MMERFVRAGLVWPTVLALVGTLILLSLGNWQFQRKAWKDDLQKRLEAARAAAPVPLGDLLVGSTSEDIQFRRTRVKGTFRHDLEFHYWQPGKDGPGWSILTPLVLEDAVRSEITRGKRDEVSAVLVDRGRVPAARKDASMRKSGNPDGVVEVVGRVRVGNAPALFVSPPDFEKNEWYARDLRTMRKHLGNDLGAAEIARGLPRVYIEAEAPTGGPEGPQPVLEALSLANRHLSYALTWWGLAATLIGVYAAFAWSRWRRAGAIAV